MARKKGGAVYRVTEIVGTSSNSWEDAARRAVETASKTLRDLRVAEVQQLDMTVENGKVAMYRARVSRGLSLLQRAGGESVFYAEVAGGDHCVKRLTRNGTEARTC